MSEPQEPAAAEGAAPDAPPPKEDRQQQRAALRAQRSAALDKVIAEHVGDDEDDDAAPEPDGDGDDEADLHVGEAAEIAEPGDDEDEPAEGDDDEEEAEGEDENDEETALFDAQLVLREAGVPASVIKSTARGTLFAWAERVLEQGKKSEKAASEADAEQSGTATETAKKGTPAPAQAALPPWSEFSKLAVDEFGASEDAVSKVFKPLHDAVGSVLAQNAELLKQVTAANSAATKREGQAIVETEMQRLTGKYPALRRDEKMRDAVLDEVQTLAAGMKARGLEIDVQQVFAKAARNVAGRPKRSDLQQLKRNGTSHAPTTRHDASEPASTEDEFWGNAADLVEAGASRERMSRMLGQPPKSMARRRRR